MFPKKIRTEDRALLDSYFNKPCACCGDQLTTVAHHIKSKGSGGPDEAWNLIALCTIHHTEIHKRGASFMIQNYFNFGNVLHKLGWELDVASGKLRRK